MSTQRFGRSAVTKFVRDDVVHYGYRAETEHGSRVWFLCERERLLSALYGKADAPLMYEPGVEVFHVVDEAKARLGCA